MCTPSYTSRCFLLLSNLDLWPSKVFSQRICMYLRPLRQSAVSATPVCCVCLHLLVCLRRFTCARAQRSRASHSTHDLQRPSNGNGCPARSFKATPSKLCFDLSPRVPAVNVYFSLPRRLTLVCAADVDCPLQHRPTLVRAADVDCPLLCSRPNRRIFCTTSSRKVHVHFAPPAQLL